MLYRAKCNECNEMSCMTSIYGYTLYWMEEHMMKTGHILTEEDNIIRSE